MAETRNATTTGTEHELVMAREFDAPRELVWKAWTEPERLASWWGPKGFTTRVEELDLRVDGRWTYVMVGPDGAEYPATGVFREIVPQERIVTSDEFGEGYEPPPGMEVPQGIELTVLFEDLGAKTRVTLRITHATPEDRRKHEEMGVVAGWNSSLDCLAEHLATLTK